jgi:hypothetical protein
MKLRVKPDAAARLVWSVPDSTIAPFCSLCQTHIPDEEVPLMMWDSEGACVQLCDRCAAECVEASK